MNFLVGPMVIAFTLYSGYSWALGYKTPRGVVVSWTRRSLFQYKVEHRLVGGTVEVFDAGRNLVRKESIDMTSNTISFNSFTPGIYSIKVAKGVEEFDFTYVKSA